MNTITLIIKFGEYHLVPESFNAQIKKFINQDSNEYNIEE